MTAFLSYAFRPFFLLNGLFAIVSMAVWVVALRGTGPIGIPANATHWHGHEMLVGFAMAAIAGFILTAVATWTGRPALRGVPLALLVLAWLTGRLAMGFAAWIPPYGVALLDLAFPALLVVLVAREVIGGGNRRNYPIVVITALLAALDGLYHLGRAGVAPPAYDMDRVALYLLLHIALLLITVIAGRIVPNFSTNWLRARGHGRLPVTISVVDRLAIGLTALTGLSAALAPTGALTGALALAAAGVHAYRLSRWRGPGSGRSDG